MINSKLSFLEGVFGKYKYHSNSHEAVFNCPFCSHHKPKFSVNILTDQWKCWICDKRGNKLIFPMKQVGASREQIQNYINSFNCSGVKINNRYTGPQSNVQLPESFVALENCKKSLVGSKAFSYLKRRGISDGDILKFKVGITFDGDFAGRIIFPSFNKKGQLNFFTGRSINGHYLNVTVPKGYRNTIILNELNIDWSKPVVITEGFVDMLKSTSNTIPLYGSVLHDDSFLWETIVLNAKEVVMALDPDAWKKQDAICKKLNAYDVPVSIMKISKKDLGDCEKEEVLEIYENRVSWNVENSFLRRVRALC